MNATLPRLVFTYLLLLLCTLVFFGPILFMLVGSLKPDDQVLADAASLAALWPREAGLDNYHSVFERVPFASYLASSLLINGLIVGLGLLVNALAGYALARLRWWGRETMLAVVVAILVIPFEAIAIPLFYQLSALSWRDDHLVQAIPFVANPLAIYLFYSFFLGLPRALEEAARVDGAGVLRTFFSIVIPNSKAAFASVAIVTFLFHWGMYLWPLLMTTSESVRPLPLGIASFHTLPPLAWGDILAFGVLMVLPVLVVFVVFQRWFVAGVASTGIKG
ncbi:sugar ABC transporter permease [Ectothiorhodospira haloalkaliphila]|uniref:sn-glycerol-3-phosphate transport system permease protein UgpE n=1 Tax=Ectothiorhodospira haloalkaliphila TaxID=421628 RepID=W8L2N7_9GAMM|nr:MULTISPECIES: carbohydrate ABC transporter permease [Ectothiorhodospira]AHK78180.1 sugar ABC transporter permease [Ectothiorhodospira haloalkaliphila]MCG5495506.1 carbohydrate ABC transporter permease [Ectothiorhodospira variabilis]MCG5499128.1 carbohydrate ABC transporter permease [Ectothiorhodospira variabilis]MCG5503885.1 carbohydrate ABC transporter permease [Ectothiorhodospira variabilis]MCG5506984.1 carbohydrate ABC transporter permease [Ectothiorhodospira variabilis]